jgi:nitroreductase
MNQVVECILGRRSIRKYRPDQIPRKDLETIVLAGLHAPNAGARQSAIMVVCQNRDINEALGAINCGAQKGRPSVATVNVSQEQPSILDDPTIVSGFYGAPTVITLFAPEGFVNGVGDCCTMAENIMLAAHALGIGSCMVARAGQTFDSEYGRKLAQEWAIGQDYRAQFHVVLGYRDGEAPKGKPHREGRVKWVS